MSLTSGTRLGLYEIVAPLGAGGMGAVYRAIDTRLNRTVAIKAMHASGALDPDHVARFEREAQLLASLNHPNIAAIHGLETVENATYLVLEFVDGRPLSDVLRDGALPLTEALPIARQIADALATTHERGIIHRDLKPGNIMVTADGQVKVLDFGLGKTLDSGLGTPDPTNSPTMTLAATQAGIILGTAGYMSPEQAKGRNADKRSDVWAFGCVLFEMLSGRRAFEGEDITETLAAIVRGEPEWSLLPATTPPAIRTLIERCLIKNRAERLPDMSVVKFLLNESAVLAQPAQSPTRPAPSRVAWMVAGVASLAALVLAVLAFSGTSTPEPQRATQLQLLLPDGFASSGFNGGWAQIAPDGRALLMTGTEGLWLRSLESGETTLIADTAGATYPFWSPDSQHIAFFRQGKLKRLAARGGPVVDICPATDPRGGTWSRDNVILFAPGLSSGLYQVSASGGTPEIVVAPTPGASAEFIRYPSFLPDGQHFLFQRTMAQETGFYLGSLDGTPGRLLRPVASSAVYAPPSGGEHSGRLLFTISRTLMSQPFDLGTMQLAGEMSPIAEAVADSGQNGNGAFSVSSSGVLVYAGAAALKIQMVLLDRLGRQAATVGSLVDKPEAAMSRDGRQVAYASTTDRALFLQQVAGGPPTQIAEPRALSPVWSSDGRIAFSRSGLSYELFIKHLDGTAQEEPLGVSAPNAITRDWSADGKWIAYDATDNATALDLWLVPLDGDRTPVAFLKTPAQEGFARFSPDSKWLAYMQVEAGRSEVFVQAIAPTGSATGIKFRISSAGGTLPRWRRDAKELIYASADGKVIGVPIALSATVELGSPQVLFDLPGGANLLDITHDAQRFLVGVPAGAGARANALTVIMNWQAGVKK